jgi:hypothetical protein
MKTLKIAVALLFFLLSAQVIPYMSVMRADAAFVFTKPTVTTCISGVTKAACVCMGTTCTFTSGTLAGSRGTPIKPPDDEAGVPEPVDILEVPSISQLVSETSVVETWTDVVVDFTPEAMSFLASLGSTMYQGPGNAWQATASIVNTSSGDTYSYEIEVPVLRRDRFANLFLSIPSDRLASYSFNEPSEGASMMTYSFRLNSVSIPEPATIILLGAGVGALVVWRRRSKRAQEV